MTLKAKQLAPVGIGGTLQNSIKWDKINNLTYHVGTNLPYAPYVEFGTGVKVQIPAEFQEMANRAKQQKSGSFKDGLENIKRWCKLKGIDEKFAYIILVNLINNGMHPQPFMYPAYVDSKATFNTNIKKAVKQLNKKFNG